MNKEKLTKIMLTVAFSLIIPSMACFAENVIMEANKQNYNGENNKATLEGNVKVKTGDITVNSQKAHILMNKNGEASEAVFSENPKVTKINGNSKSEVKANIIKLSLLNNIVTAEGNVKSTVVANSKPLVTIKADNQEFNMKTNIMHAAGNVVINYNDLETHSNQANINVDASGSLSKVRLLGNAEIIKSTGRVKANSFLYNPKTDEMVAEGNTYSLSMLQGKNSVAVWADYQQYDKTTGTLMTSGGVKIKYMDYVATGPKASFIPDVKGGNPNKIIFIGRSKVQQDNKIVEADKLEITVNPKNFNAEGNVRTKFVQFNKYDKNNKL